MRGIGYYLRRVPQHAVIAYFKLRGPPRILRFSPQLNSAIVKAFGAQVGEGSLLCSPITLGGFQRDCRNLVIGDRCVINGNNFLDLTERIVLEDGVSLGPGVIVMTHNGYNRNAFLEGQLPHTCGRRPVRIGAGTGVKAGALIVMGVTVGRDCVVGGNAVINRDVPDRCFMAGVPARLVKKLDEIQQEDGDEQLDHQSGPDRDDPHKRDDAACARQPARSG